MNATPVAQQFDENRLAAARLIAGDVQPFLAIALYALSPVSAPGLGTFAVDKRWRLYIDPQALENWSVQEVAGVLLHEVGHVVRDHAGRAELLGVDDDDTKTPWNYAADAEINDDLRSDDIALPGSPVYPESLGMPGDKAAEFYYEYLVRNPRRHKEIPDCGSGCHGIDQDAATASDVGRAPIGLDSSEVLLIRQRVAELIVQSRGTLNGSISGGWERWAEAQLHPKLDWRRLLAASIRGSIAAVRGANDYSYARPARRSVPRVVLPSLVRPLPTVAIVIDTSGSISNRQLGAAWTEVHGCLKNLGVRRHLLRIYSGDVEMQRLSVPIDRTVHLVGGGGTDMRVGISLALAARPAPNIVVVLTDGYTPWPERKPHAQLVVALFAADDSPPPTPSWARVVVVDAE